MVGVETLTLKELEMDLFEVAVLRRVGDTLSLVTLHRPFIAKDAKAAEYTVLVDVDLADHPEQLEVRVRPFAGA